MSILMNALRGIKNIGTAPKDGTKIIIFWRDHPMDSDIRLRDASWWKPTELQQWEAGARPHWAYVSDNDFSHEISEDRIIGWIPMPIMDIDIEQEFNSDFMEYLMQARKEFVSVVCKYRVRDHGTLRTEADNFLIAYDQSVDKLNQSIKNNEKSI